MIDYLALASGLDDAFAAAPLVVLALAGIVCLLAVAFARRPKPDAVAVAAAGGGAFAICAIGLALAIAALIGFSLPMMPRRIGSLLSMDGLSFAGTAIILVSSLAIALSSRPYFAQREDERGEYYALLLFATLGAVVLAASSNLATLFLGLELLSVSLYALVAYRRERPEAAKAAFTYLILASVASAFLFFGMALAYYQTGSLELSAIVRAASASGGTASGGPLLTASFALMGVGFAFKLAIVPFHMWAPEVYEGSSAPVAALIATVSKAAMAMPLIRVLAPLTGAVPIAGAAPLTDGAAASLAGGPDSSIAWIIAALAGASMLAGNLLALREDKVKRMLAGSSIAQLGYILVALVAGGAYGASAALFYLAAYSLSTLGVFACVAALSPADRDAGSGTERPREDFRGLAAKRPFLAAVMTASLLSLAGMPLTAGFIGKFMLFSAGLGRSPGAGTATRVLAVLLALNSALSLFYYLRLLSVMYRTGAAPEPVAAGAEPPAPRWTPTPKGSLLAGAALGFIGLAILVLGTSPGSALDLIASLALK